MLRSLLISGVLGLGQLSAIAQTTQPQDAAKLYAEAAKLIRANDAINIMSPSSSNSGFPPFPPSPGAWVEMEKASFEANAAVRELVHEARSIQVANWPPTHSDPKGVSYLNECRNIANEVGDAVLYQQQVKGDDAAAFESLRDEGHLADLMQNQPNKTLVRLLVSIGIRAVACYRFEVITSGVVLTKDPSDSKDLQISVARDLIAQLLQQEDANAEINVVLHDEHTTVNAITKPSIDRIIETCNRGNSECALAAMSLACHLFKFDTGNWPKSLDDLHDYLPSVPIDPWGDGTQTLGYVLVKRGLPDGSDRPLVFSRGNSKDGLFYRNDYPEYGFYVGDGSANPRKQQKQGGEFRDVTRWSAVQGRATTQAVEDQEEVPVMISPK